MSGMSWDGKPGAIALTVALGVVLAEGEADDDGDAAEAEGLAVAEVLEELPPACAPVEQPASASAADVQTPAQTSPIFLPVVITVSLSSAARSRPV
jgi:hypothetical protein